MIPLFVWFCFALCSLEFGALNLTESKPFSPCCPSSLLDALLGSALYSTLYITLRFVIYTSFTLRRSLCSLLRRAECCEVIVRVLLSSTIRPWLMEAAQSKANSGRNSTWMPMLRPLLEVCDRARSPVSASEATRLDSTLYHHPETATSHLIAS